MYRDRVPVDAVRRDGTEARAWRHDSPGARGDALLRSPPTCPAPGRLAGYRRSTRLGAASDAGRDTGARFVPTRLPVRAALCAHGPRSNVGDTRTRCLLVVVTSDRSQSVSGSNMELLSFVRARRERALDMWACATASRVHRRGQ